MVWFASSPPCHKPAERDAGSGTVFGGPIPVKVKGTVKSHGERDGRPQTVLTRAAITWPAGLPQSWDALWAAQRAKEEALCAERNPEGVAA